jgi:hypothetical protein
MPGLDDYLDEVDKGAVPAEESPEQEQAVEQETGAEDTQDAAETTDEPAKPATKPEEGLQAALLAERRKRQELEQQLAAKQEKPDFWEDPEARLADTEAKFQQQLVMQKLDISEAFAREKYTDFDEKLEIFAALTQENPALYQQMVQQVNPAEFAYKTALSQQKLKEMGDPLKYEAELEKKLRAKWEAEKDAENKKKASLPGSIATTAGASGNAAVSWSGPTPLDDLLK